MESKGTKVCPNCGAPTKEDVCQQCGHIINPQVINNADITVTKNVAYNLFLMCLNALGIILFAAASVKPIIFLVNGQKEVAEGMPTVASAVLTVGPLVLLFYLLINLFIKKALVDKKGAEVSGVVYGYCDDLYEHEKGTREEICYIQYRENGNLPGMIKISFNLKNHKNMTQDDRPYPIDGRLRIKIYHDMFYII